MVRLPDVVAHVSHPFVFNPPGYVVHPSTSTLAGRRPPTFNRIGPQNFEGSGTSRYFFSKAPIKKMKGLYRLVSRDVNGVMFHQKTLGDPSFPLTSCHIIRVFHAGPWHSEPPMEVQKVQPDSMDFCQLFVFSCKFTIFLHQLTRFYLIYIYIEVSSAQTGIKIAYIPPARMPITFGIMKTLGGG